MGLIHKAPDFADLLVVVGQQVGVRPGLVEKDNWLTHALWALLHQGFDVWFKGGTSLSKAFGIIKRFPEDLDLKVTAGSVPGMPLVSNWRSKGTLAVAGRRACFDALATTLDVARTERSPDPV